MDKTKIHKELSSRMDGAIKVLDHELTGLRTGRASVNLLDPVTVDAYGNRVQISQVATISTPDAKTITVQVWDKTMVKAIEKAIVDANLGLSPASDGQLVRMNIPPLTEERRKELVKLAHKYGENTKVSLRNIRRDANEELKKIEKNNEISKDEHHHLSDEIQKLTDEFSNKVDSYIKKKEQEILTI